MRYFITLLLFLVFLQNASAQNDTGKVVTQRLNSRERPRFPGGESELKKYLALNLRYPNEAFNNNIQGEVVVSFRIDESGKISDISSLKSLGYGCDEEAIRVVKKMPEWEPAKRNGKKIAVIYNLPVVFELPKQLGHDSK